MTPQSALPMPPGASAPVAPPNLDQSAMLMGAGPMGPSAADQQQQDMLRGQLNQLKDLDQQCQALSQIPAISDDMAEISKKVRDAMSHLVSRAQPVEQSAPKILG